MSENYKAIVWSKNNCSYCDMVKMMLSQHNVEIEERNIETTSSLEDLRKVLPTARTLPQVFINSKYIGGFTAVQEYLNKL